MTQQEIESLIESLSQERQALKARLDRNTEQLDALLEDYFSEEEE